MQNPKKQPTILQVLPALRSGGVERGTVEVAAAIVKQGGRALVASGGGPMETQLRHVGAKHVTLPLGSKNPLYIWRNISALENIIRTYEVDIVHARSRAPAWSAYYAARHCGVPFMTTFHGTYGLESAFKKYYNGIMVKGERVIAISNFIAEHIRQNYNVDPEKIRIIPRGVDINAFDPAKIAPQRMAELVNAWHIPADVPILLMPGRFTRWKGQAVLVEALASLPHRNFYCVMFGDREEHPGFQQELETLIRTHRLEGHVLMAGSTPSMPEAYMLADVVLCPSTEPEAFGRVPIEAQAMSRPVIATNHGGACETVENNATGWLVPPSDSAALAAAIDKALSLSRFKRQHMGERGMKRVREDFTTEAMCRKTLEVYGELLDSGQ